jgi:nickel-dependent lactate racemase
MDLTQADGIGRIDPALTEDEIDRVVGATLDRWRVDGGRVLVLIPDGTRSCPLGLLFRSVYRLLAPRVAVLDFMVALGTHQPMTDDEILRRVEITADEHAARFAKARFMNHRWNDPGALSEIGRLTRAEVETLSGGRLSIDVGVTINRAVHDYDRLMILGPVFPHEVVGFSGGNKYLFPGISGPEFLHFFHWLGALITNRAIIGRKHTPVRTALDRAAAMLDVDRRALCMVVRGDGALAGLWGGTPELAWSAAAELSAQVHVVRVPRPFATVLSRAPTMYPDLWTGGKCMYKLEPAVADGGRLIIWAPHIREVSRVHGALLGRIGYHVRDYFVRQWDRFRSHPWGILAHSTHVKGDGTWLDGVETPRIEVALATGIPEAVCRAINLGYVDPASIDPADWIGREGEGLLYVPRAGEVLYRCD